jgi:hypothetical protein
MNLWLDNSYSDSGVLWFFRVTPGKRCDMTSISPAHFLPNASLLVIHESFYNSTFYILQTDNIVKQLKKEITYEISAVLTT